eukprot:3403934-Rhodomonas_salina.3
MHATACFLVHPVWGSCLITPYISTGERVGTKRTPYASTGQRVADTCEYRTARSECLGLRARDLVAPYARSVLDTA